MKKNLKNILNFSLYILIILIVTLFVVKYVGQKTVVIGHSMEPTLHDNDNLIADKLSYHLHEPRRFDIVIFPNQYEKNTYFIKRVIGLPGETIKIDAKGNIFIDGAILEEHYGSDVIKDAGIAANEIKLAPDEYFVLGDNRNDSLDSRFVTVGNVHRNLIMGKAWLRIYPFSVFGFIK